MKIPVCKKRETPVVPAEQCLAKTCGTQKGCDVQTHLVLCALTLRALREAFRNTPRESLLPPAAEWLAALHDIGKATPGFQQKIHAAVHEPLQLGAAFSQPDHAEYSGWILRQRYGEKFAELAASHHGVAGRRLGNPATCNDDAELCGGSGWSALRNQICDRVFEFLNMTPELPVAIAREISQPILGAVILADWISSGMEVGFGEPVPVERVPEAVAAAGFRPLAVTPGLDFKTLFGFEPNALQHACLREPEVGEIIVVEAEMGGGKTESALYMAYRMLVSGRANGIYFALPTQLTSEKIHVRLNEFLEKILPEDQKRDALLIHGDAWLEWNLKATTPEDCDTSQNPDSWFQSKKRALLAPFGAGTVDQALLAVLNVKHNAVRAFGLAGKVVIVDECHSYDHFTGFLLRRLIQQLRNYHATVIILSATLTCEARRAFGELGAPAVSPEPPVPYPLLTVNCPGSGEMQMPFAGDAPHDVKLAFTGERAEAMNLAMEKAASGEQVLWIENTVAAAQAVFRQLNALPPVGDCEIGLIHSRFPRCRRMENETLWVETLGKHGENRRRERGRILVSTQIVEQSVDIDSDFLISQLAPMDMLFQRIGRLWRHRTLDSLRPPTAERRALILVDPLLEEPERLRTGADALLPYEAYYLYRTWEVLRSRESLTLPGDIRPLLEAVYRKREESGALAALRDRLAGKIEILENKARIASGTVFNVQNDDSASTRINDVPTVQVLLLAKNNRGHALADGLFSPFDAEPIPLPSGAATKHERTVAACRIQRALLTVPEHRAPGYEGFPADFLAPLLWIGEGATRPIRVAWLDADGRLLDRAANPLPFTYHEKLGYMFDSL